MNTEQKETLQNFVNQLGIEYNATFQPTPQPQSTVKHPQLHWVITLTKGTRKLQTEYSQGVAHVLGYKQSHKTPYDKRKAEEMYRKTCETGKLYNHYSDTFGWMPRSIGPKVQPAPDLLDVLYCLVMDASVLNNATFEEWAEEYGYDSDSRKAEGIYRKCLEQSLALKNLIGSQKLEMLGELFQDY